jgi:hypothetical protein
LSLCIDVVGTVPARAGSPSRTPSYGSPLLILRASSQTANSFTDQPTATAVPFGTATGLGLAATA